MDKKWREQSFVAFDTETTGKYPLESELCEIAAVKWEKGEIVDSFQSLIKPTQIMGQEVIRIHNITNEMVTDAPPAGEVVKKFYEFMGESVLIAHHAPFDLGFVCPEFEKLNLSLPKSPVLCSSLLSRKLVPESSNHKLQTLIKVLNLDGGTAHRALDDTKACMQLALICFERLGEEKTIRDLAKVQDGAFYWEEFSISQLESHPVFGPLVQASLTGSEVSMVYKGGSRPGKEREIIPIGIVRSPRGDFLVAKEPGHPQAKRYFLNKISRTKIV